LTLPRDNINTPAAPAIRRRLAAVLLRWFDHHRRDLPWRMNRDPYRIWVSEVMLQQTQVATVIPFFERFLQRFPSVASLAKTDEQAVLRLWEGLGYYRRARDLYRAARLLLQGHKGNIPNDPAILGKLPGWGRYTTNAVLSQAFDRRLPILEANSQRVLSRLFGWADDPRTGPARKRLWSVAQDLIPSRRVGDFNQALMELGALVCTPNVPACDRCPLSRRCEAYRLGLQTTIPARKLPEKATLVQETAIVMRRGPNVLLVQRPASGRWPSLWEFPHGPLAKGETFNEAGKRIARSLTGLEIELGSELTTVRHTVTRYQINLVCFEANFRKGQFRSPFYLKCQWVRPQDLANFPVSSPQRKLIRALGQTGR
jgi:A/G-specific adenine glycosylase